MSDLPEGFLMSKPEVEVSDRFAEYVAWIAENVSDPLGRCHEFVAKMNRVFPELEPVYGEYLCARWGPRSHRWRGAPAGRIVDPTVEQCPCRSVPEAYVPEPPDAKRPTGRCLECGDLVYDGGNFCSPACEGATIASLMGEFK